MGLLGRKALEKFIFTDLLALRCSRKFCVVTILGLVVMEGGQGQRSGPAIMGQDLGVSDSMDQP